MRREDEELFARMGAASGEDNMARLIGRLVAEDLRKTVEAPLPDRMRHLLHDLHAGAGPADAAGGEAGAHGITPSVPSQSLSGSSPR